MKRTKVPIYDVPLLFFRTCEEAARYAAPEDLEAQETAKGSDGIAIGMGSRGVAMAVDPDHECPSLVAHEALHVAWRVLDSAGVHVDAENHEALAYLQGMGN